LLVDALCIWRHHPEMYISIYTFWSYFSWCICLFRLSAYPCRCPHVFRFQSFLILFFVLWTEYFPSDKSQDTLRTKSYSQNKQYSCGTVVFPFATDNFTLFLTLQTREFFDYSMCNSESILDMSWLLHAKLDSLVWKAKGWQLWNILTSAWTLYLPGPASLGSVARQLWVRRPAALVSSLNRPIPSTLKAHT
jgi:hypothetical protein